MDGSFSTELSQMTRMWAVAIHKHSDDVDGFVYVSRHINTANAVVLFDRATGNLQAPRYHSLLAHAGAVSALKALAVDFI